MEHNDTNSAAGIPQYRVTPRDESGRRLLRRYLDRRRGELAQLREALERSDFELIRRIGHNLRGSGAAYDLIRISALGERLELAAEQSAQGGLTAIIAELEQFLDSVTIAEPG